MRKLILPLFFILLTSILYSQIPRQDNLLLYYPFNGNTNDESGNNNNGSIIGSIALTPDNNGNQNSAYNFTDGEIRSTNSISVANSSFTISVMTKVLANDTYQSNPHMFSLGNASTRNGLHLSSFALGGMTASSVSLLFLHFGFSFFGFYPPRNFQHFGRQGARAARFARPVPELEGYFKDPLFVRK